MSIPKIWTRNVAAVGMDDGRPEEFCELPGLPNGLLCDPRVQDFRRVLSSAPGFELAEDFAVGSLDAGRPLALVFWKDVALPDHWCGGFDVDGHGCHIGLLISDDHHDGINKV